MSDAYASNRSKPVFRIDRFNVPAHALPTFMERVRLTQRSLDGQPGCRQNLVLSQPDIAGEYNVMTVVEWIDEESFSTAKAMMQQRYTNERFDPAAFMQSLGVKADLGIYRSA